MKLIKLEDQLGLSRWTTWSEVKMEPPDDIDDSSTVLIEEGGMEWVPVKQELVDPEDPGEFPPVCFNRTDAGGCEEEEDMGATSAVRVTADQSSSATCVTLAAVVNSDISGLTSQASMDGARGSTGASIVLMSPETQGSPMATSSHIVVANSPKIVGLSVSQDSASCTEVTTGVTVTSPQVPGLDALNIQSPQVKFVAVSNLSGNVTLSERSLQAAEDEVAIMDITSSQLMAVDDQTVRGLEDVVVAAATSSPSPRKLVSKKADRHAHKKGKKGRKPNSASVKKAPTTVKRAHGKKRGRPPKNSKSHVSVPDSTVTIPSADTNHLDDLDGVSVVSKPKRNRKETAEPKEKGMFPMHPTLDKRIQTGNGSAYNLFRLAHLLPNEDMAVEFGQYYNLLPKFRFCPLCGQRLDKMYRIGRPGKRPLFRFQCNRQPCKMGRNQVPLRWGTKFVSSNLSLRKAILLDYCFIKKYDTPTARSETAMPDCEDSDRMVSTSTETVVDYYNNCREICAYFLMSLPPIGGLGYTVEIFESYFMGSKSHNEGGSKSHKVHAFQGQYVLAGICIENNDVLFAVAPDLASSTVLPLLQSKIALGTHVRTSSCDGYAQLKKFGYEHTVIKDNELFVNHDLNFSGCSNVTQGGTMRPLAFHRRSGTFNLHLAEYLWRRKHRDSTDLFVSYMETMASVYPITVPAADEEADD